MFQFFASIASLIDIVINFVVNMFSFLYTVIESVIRSVAWLILCISYLPGWLTAFLLVPVSLSVVFQVLNKGG